MAESVPVEETALRSFYSFLPFQNPSSLFVVWTYNMISFRFHRSYSRLLRRAYRHLLRVSRLLHRDAASSNPARYPYVLCSVNQRCLFASFNRLCHFQSPLGDFLPRAMETSLQQNCIQLRHVAQSQWWTGNSSCTVQRLVPSSHYCTCFLLGCNRSVIRWIYFL